MIKIKTSRVLWKARCPPSSADLRSDLAGLFSSELNHTVNVSGSSGLQLSASSCWSSACWWSSSCRTPPTRWRSSCGETPWVSKSTSQVLLTLDRVQSVWTVTEMIWSLFNCWCGCLSQICCHTLHDKRFLKGDFKVKVSDDDDDGACLSSGVVLQCVGRGRSSQSGGSGPDSSNDGLPLFTRGQHRYVRHLSIVLKRNDWLSN